MQPQKNRKGREVAGTGEGEEPEPDGHQWVQHQQQLAPQPAEKTACPSSRSIPPSGGIRAQASAQAEHFSLTLKADFFDPIQDEEMQSIPSFVRHDD